MVSSTDGEGVSRPGNCEWEGCLQRTEGPVPEQRRAGELLSLRGHFLGGLPSSGVLVYTAEVQV